MRASARPTDERRGGTGHVSVRMVAGAEEPCGYEGAVQDWWQADPGVKLGTFDEAARSGEALVFEIVR